MAKTQTVRARVEPRVKRDADAVFNKIGLTQSEAITLFLTQVALHKGLPFPVRIPNRATRDALREARDGKGTERFDDVQSWKKAVRSV